MLPLFKPALVGQEWYSLMNLNHPRVEKDIMAEMSRGIAVFYDVRWDITEVFTTWLAENPDLFHQKRVLVLGAGVGAETLILGRHAQHLWLNDLSPTALALCREQLLENQITNATFLPGRYEQLDLPEVDLVVGSFLVYDEETYQAMSTFMDSHRGELILVNEPLDPFPRMRRERPHEILFKEGSAIGCLMKSHPPQGEKDF